APLFLSIVVLFLTSCTGPTGATGETGPAGPEIPGLYFIRIFQEGVYSSTYTGQSQAVLVGGNPSVYYVDPSVPMEVGSKNAIDCYRSIIKFDLSSLPSSKIIVDKVELVLKTAGTYYGTGAENVKFLKLASAWTENQASWHWASTGTPWNNNGGDFFSNTITPDAATYNFGPNSTYTIGLDPVVVREWMTSPSTNYGMILKVDNESTTNCAEIYSSGAAVPENRPKLKIWYYTTE
ncbi:MAG: DNRLRE domain-containing protein, partial [Spirochaetia bacterium]|nr:DNRLRE domain-containing protein [Spirochaetia bacterium]